MVHHNANVKLLGVKGSEKYKFLGFSHNLSHSREDTDFCENIGLNYFTPETEHETRKVINNTYENRQPVYIRL